MKVIKLRDGKERSLLRRHPWVFEGSVAKGKADAGETVRVEAADGGFLAWGAYSPESAIRVRAWSFDEAQRIDAAFFEQRIARAVQLRSRLALPSNGVRLIHGEADGLPGLIVDVYADTLCAQFLCAGVERWKAPIADGLLKATGLTCLYERSDASVRALEGLQPVTGWLRGDGPTEVEIYEHEWRFQVDIAKGHKTGFYLDQRDNRHHFADAVRRFGHRRVLNCFCYTGGFSVAALSAGATEVVSVDSSGPALVRAAQHVALNGLETKAHQVLEGDVNQTRRRSSSTSAGSGGISNNRPIAASLSPRTASRRRRSMSRRFAVTAIHPPGLGGRPSRPHESHATANAS